MSCRSIHFIVSGTVHGVGFRYFVKTMADQKGIVGWVKNDPGGTVVGVAQGKEDAMARFRKDLEVGPLHAHVTGVQISSEQTVSGLEFYKFEIRH